MQWTSESIIIKQQKFSDDKLLCWVFSETQGVYKGLLYINKKTRSQIQVGNIVEATWKARLPEHLGSYYCEVLKPISMAIINDRFKLSSVASLCDILSICLPERVSEVKLYDASISYLMTLKDYNNWLVEYLKLEFTLLQEIGYGLDLKTCAVSGEKDNLYYVSPRTGKAVTKENGEKYHNKLLRLPEFFTKEKVIVGNEEILLGFKLMNHFFNKYIIEHQLEMPSSRLRLSELAYSSLK